MILRKFSPTQNFRRGLSVYCLPNIYTQRGRIPSAQPGSTSKDRSSVQTDSTRLTRAYDAVRALIGSPAEIEHLHGGGRTSRIYHVRSGSREFALKQYPSRSDDPRDRLSTEVGALNLMESYRINTVPRVAGVDRERGFVLLSWIDGTAVTEIADADIDAAINFLAALPALRNTPWTKEQPPAAEACLSGAEIERQIVDRLKLLQSFRDEGGLA